MDRAVGPRVVLATNPGPMAQAGIAAGLWPSGQPDPDKAPARFDRFHTNKVGVLSHEEFILMGAASKP